MKIKRYQQGGGVTYLPYVGRVAGATSPSTSSSPKNGGLDDTTSGLLAKNGLPSDHAYFMSQMASLYTNDPLTSDSTSTSTKLLMLHSLANNMMYNKGLSDSAWKEVESTEAGGDVAMSSSGRLYAIDSKGSIKTISPESYYQNRDKYQLLTNTELLNYRDTNTSAAFNTSILPDLQNITSMKSIVEYLQNTITKFGTTEMKNKNSALTVQEKNQISNGMQTLINGNAEGVFKITQTTHSKTEVQDVNVALKYLWDTLTSDQKKTIIAHTAAEGKDPSKIENVYSILALALTHHIDTAHDTSMDVEYDSSASKGMGIGGGVKSEQQTQLTYLEMVANGKTTADQWIDLRSNTGKSNIYFVGNPYQVLDHSNKPVKTESISKMLLDSQVGQIVDQSSVSFGNKILGVQDKAKVLYDSQSPMYRVNLPYDVEYYNNTGKYKPDINAQENFDKFIKWINDTNPTQIMITQKMKDLKLNLDIFVDDQGRKHYKFKNNKEFIMMTGITSHRAVDISDKWKGKLSNEEASYLYDYLDKHTEYDEALWNIWGDAASTYKSASFMPIIDSALATVGTSGEYIPKSYKTDMQNRTEYNNTINNIPTNF